MNLFEIRLIWNPQVGVYVEDGEQHGDDPRWNPATGEMLPGCHWWTVDEARMEGVECVGGPLSDVPVAEGIDLNALLVAVLWSLAFWVALVVGALNVGHFHLLP